MSKNGFQQQWTITIINNALRHIVIQLTLHKAQQRIMNKCQLRIQLFYDNDAAEGYLIGSAGLSDFSNALK